MKALHILKPSKKKIVILIVIFVLAILAFRFLGVKKPPVWQYASVKKQDIKSTVSSAGNLTGKSVVDLKFGSSGKLSFINVAVGDTVSKYQVVAGLDVQDLNITLQQAYNTLRDKEAAKEKAEDDVKGHDKDESFTQKVSRTTAEVAKDNAFDSVKAAKRDFQDAIIFSPIEGLVIQAVTTSGQTVFATDLIAQIVDTSGFYFDSDVDEADISKVSVGTPTEVTLDAYPGQTFLGKVDQILPQTKLTSSGATVVTVRILLDNPKIVFVNGLSGESSIIYQTSFNTLTIPQEALKDNNIVMVEANKKLVPKKVETGISSDTDVEIKSGLSEGEKVLLN